MSEDLQVENPLVVENAPAQEIVEETVVKQPSPGRKGVDPSTVALIETLALQGKNAAQIAKATGISYPTVRKYMQGTTAPKVETRRRGKAKPVEAIAKTTMRRSVVKKLKSAPTKVTTTMLPPAPSEFELVLDIMSCANKHRVPVRELVSAIEKAERLQVAVANKLISPGK